MYTLFGNAYLIKQQYTVEVVAAPRSGATFFFLHTCIVIIYILLLPTTTLLVVVIYYLLHILLQPPLAALITLFVWNNIQQHAVVLLRTYRINNLMNAHAALLSSSTTISRWLIPLYSHTAAGRTYYQQAALATSYSIHIIITYVCLAGDLHSFLASYLHAALRRWNSTRYRIFVHAVPSVCTQQQQLFCLLPNETTTCHKQPRAYWRLKTDSWPQHWRLKTDSWPLVYITIPKT